MKFEKLINETVKQEKVVSAQIIRNLKVLFENRVEGRSSELVLAANTLSRPTLIHLFRRPVCAWH